MVNLINQVQETELNRALTAMFSLDIPSPGDGGSGGDTNYAGGTYFAYRIDTNQLWLEITNAANGWSGLNLHSGTNQFSCTNVFAIWSTTNLLMPFSAWNMEMELFPTLDQTYVLSFVIQNLDRQNLFFRAEDWTGVDSDGDGVPDWWAWQYFGLVNIPFGTNTFIQDYSNNIPPTVFTFSGIEMTNDHIASSLAPLQLEVAGYPYYQATLVDDTTLADAGWTNYVSTNLVVDLGLIQGWHGVVVGLRGHADSIGAAVWQWKRLNVDWTPPTITVTSPAAGASVTGSFLQVQGMADEALSSLTYAVSNATGILTNQPGYVTGQYLDLGTQLFTTNYFQLQNIQLADGVNTVTIHAADLAGNLTTTTLNCTRSASPPAFSLIWPQSETVIVGDQFTVQGMVDDVTATITAAIVDANGNTNTVQGIVEKSGAVWINQVPLAAGESTLTITATGITNGTSQTILTVQRSSVTVTLNPLTGDQLNKPVVSVGGTVSDPTVQLSVNSMPATVYDDGTWTADGVPVNLSGTAVLDAEVTSGGTSSFMSRSSIMWPNGDSSDTTTGSEEFTQIQPPVVVMKSYEQHWHEDSFSINQGGRVLPGYFDFVDHWNYDAGGSYSSVWDYAVDGDYGGHATYNINLPVGDAALADASLDWVWPVWQSAAVDHYQTDSQHTFLNDADTRVMIHPQGQETLGRTNVYLVRACASEVSDPTLWYDSGDIPMPLEWLQINGQTLINSGITNDDGSVWGLISVTAPAGENADVTPVATHWSDPKDYTFQVQAAQIFPPAVDANRDGNITFDGQDQTSATNYYRFWVNNDNDGYDSSISDYADLDPSTGSDANNTSISCTRDLEDYTRLWINTQGLTTDLQNGNLLMALEWKNTIGAPAIRIFPAVETNNGGTLYLTDEATALAQSNAPYGNCLNGGGVDELQGTMPFIIPTNFWVYANVSTNQPVAHLLFDAVSRGSGQLVIAIYKNDGVTKIAEGPPLYLKLQDVKEMYERYTVGDDNAGAVATTASLASGYSYDTTIPAENNYTLFVHGWNLPTWEKDAFAETAFKRLYWQGYKGHFGSFRWPTGYGFTDWKSVVTDPDNYDNSESNAWASATGLLGKLTALNGAFPNHVYLMAHSMGNVVAGEALKLAGSSQVVNTYVAMQGAVPAHCYDASTVNRVTRTQPDYYAHYWTNDAACYFNGTAGAGTCVNYFNASDWALDKWTIDQDFKPDSGYFYGTVNGITGFFSGFGSGGPYPFLSPLADRYTIFAYADPSWSYALGAQANVSGVFSSGQLDLDATYSFGSLHKGHSAEFNSDNMSRALFWNKLLYTAFGFTR